jgi:hypothetical protein
MTKHVVEPFAAYQKLGRGIPCLQSWTYRKTMSVEWHDGSMRDYSRFASTVDADAMYAALLAVWKRCHPKRGRRMSFSGGTISGLMRYVPIENGMEAMEIVRKHSRS